MASSAGQAAETGLLETVERSTLQEQIYQQLRNSIMSGFFKPGQPLSTRAVAEAVGVSVMPVRDALRRLEVENALVVGHNRTLEVPRLDAATLQEICQMRIALEGLAVERAVGAIGQADIVMLEGLCATMQEGIRNHDSDAYLQANWAFHSQIYQCAPGEMLLSAIESLWLRMGPYFRLVATDQNHLEKAMIIHREILDALRKADGRAACQGVISDIESATGDLATWLKMQETAR
jgi:DNA-binding GntR family transcriptional regulator